MTEGRKLQFHASQAAIASNGRWLAGGVSSNFRLGMSPHPLLFRQGEGPYLFDTDGNRLIDYYLAMGPMILAHDAAVVRNAVIEQMRSGILFGGGGLTQLLDATE